MDQVLVAMNIIISQLSVGAKHLEDKLSVIAKNSSANASPVQLSVVISHWSAVIELFPPAPCSLLPAPCSLPLFS